MTTTATAAPSIGFLYPGHSAEDDYAMAEGLVEPAVHFLVVHTSVDRDTHEIAALEDTGADWRLAQGAHELHPAAPHAVMWACTSGSFVFGLDGARQQAERLAQVAAVPASSTSLAFVDALQLLGCRSVAIGATYPADLTARFEAFLADADIRVVRVGTLEIMDASAGGRMSADEVWELIHANDHPDAEAILLPDTAVHSVAHLDAWRRAANKPLLTANQVTIWQGLRLAGHPAAEDGFFRPI